MSDLSYPDKCIITRSTDEVDEHFNSVEQEMYNGKCDFQPGGQTALSRIRNNDVVYLPKAVMVLVNDNISVTSELGRVCQGTVANVRDLGLTLTGDYVTEIEIKQSVEK